MAASGYKVITKHGHPNASITGKIQEHIFVMSEMLGRPLTAIEVVHHKDEDRGNNTPTNLQLFPNRGAHNKHHSQQRALDACGNSSFIRCRYCKVYDNPINLHFGTTRPDQAWHKQCLASHNADAYKAKQPSLN